MGFVVSLLGIQDLTSAQVVSLLFLSRELETKGKIKNKKRRQNEWENKKGRGCDLSNRTLTYSLIQTKKKK